MSLLSRSVFTNVSLIVLIALLLSFPGHAQRTLLQGALYLRNYATSEYNGHAQVFSITQDGRGLLYFGNKSGVLEYDGTSWRTIIVPNEDNKDSREVSGLVADRNGTVFVAAKGDLGYLKANRSGKLCFFSLARMLGGQDLKNPRSVSFSDGMVLFHYGNAVFGYSNGNFQIWRSPEKDPYYGVFCANGRVYAAKEQTGLYVLEDGKFVPAVGGQGYIESKKIYAMLNYAGRTYIQTSEGHIDDYTDHASPKKVSLSFTLPAYNALNVYDQYYSLGTFSDGLLIFDRSFRLTYRIDQSSGLIDGNVKCQFLDREGNLWIGTNKGISKVEVISPVSRFGVEFGMNSGVESICNFRGRTYFATLSGLYYLNESFDKTSERIAKVPGLTIDCYGVKEMVFGNDTVLLVAANNGVWMLRENGGLLSFVAKSGPYNFIQSPMDPALVYVANYDGLSKIRWTGSGFKDEGYVQGFSEDIFNISVEPDGTLWLGTISNGVIRSHVSKFDANGKMIRKVIGSKDDGPSYVTIMDGTPYVGNDKGLFKISGDRLVADSDYKLPRKCGVHRVMKDVSGKVWAVLVLENNKFEIGYFGNDPDRKWESRDFQRYSVDIVHGLFHDDNGMTWLGGPSGLMLYNPSINKNYNIAYNCLIRAFSVGDSVLFSGSFTNPKGLVGSVQSKDHVYAIPYSSKSISFRFSAVSFLDERTIQYSYKLVGQDDDWSAWSANTEKSYTNLHDGEYVFMVKAKNMFGVESQIGTYRFKILSPWYRTVWAYFLYLVLFVLVIYLSIRLSSRRIRKQKEHLEEVVRERTAEVMTQKTEIEKQKELVEQKNQDIMDSIRYAKRLQDAILPTEDYVADCLKNTFVFYRPKDIVSGDFYFVRRVADRVYFAVVDCTGHGVPGAFVSIVGYNGLNRALKEYDLKHPAEILDKLSELVEEAFRQQGYGDVRDGMDIALCCLHLSTGKLEFSGANNPLYVISDEELMELKGNKQPVGLFEDRVPFTNHELQLKAGDLIVLFSDGFADQFGGDLGKKYKYTRFKLLLTGLSTAHTETIGKELIREFETWLEGYEQIDDVCVFGVRI
ncbi:MAG: SpoIIE family protein phosphatase [Bacteroidota bacterium]|jgi:serine phosphatase RsbU (regulator of sigma subunit)/ligand-binding sensor domain-containing protein